ncbi:MAG: flavodoxin domain-containing protein [Mycobacterium sp.]|nr:flavodoxin domain-containing protein [Mycobacterium sp.]
MRWQQRVAKSRWHRPATSGAPTGLDAVIVAGALYANRWHRDARRFVRPNTESLRTMPVWLVSSGPLDDSAARRSIAPTAQVAFGSSSG